MNWLRRLFRRPAPTPPGVDCDAVMRELWDYLDGELPAERAEAIAAHVAECARCSPHVAFEREFLAAVAATRRTDDATAALRTRVLRALETHGFAIETS